MICQVAQCGCLWSQMPLEELFTMKDSKLNTANREKHLLKDVRFMDLFNEKSILEIVICICWNVSTFFYFCSNAGKLKSFNEDFLQSITSISSSS